MYRELIEHTEDINHLLARWSKIWYLQEWRVQRTAVSIRRDSARDHKTGV